MSYRTERSHRAYEAARKVAERAAACREVGLELEAQKHEDRARRLKLCARFFSSFDKRVPS